MSKDINDIIARANRGDRGALTDAVRHYHRLNDWESAERLTENFMLGRPSQTFLEETTQAMYRNGVVPELVDHITLYHRSLETHFYTTWADFAFHAQEVTSARGRYGYVRYDLHIVGRDWWLTWTHGDWHADHWVFNRMPEKPLLQMTMGGLTTEEAQYDGRDDIPVKASSYRDEGFSNNLGDVVENAVAEILEKAR